jgi:enterochelin esterase-like enzyme
MLPGNIYTDSIWDELGLDEAAEADIREQSIAPMLIAMLSGGSLANTTSGGPASYESFMLEEFIPFFEGNYCALPNGLGRAIGGMSRGGYWALEIAFRHPEEFTSVGGHSAALVDYNGGPTINPSNTGLSNDLGDLRIYLDIGENDWLRPNLQELHEQMALQERAHTWVLNQGIHEEAYWATHLEEYLDWYAEPWIDAREYPPCRAISSGYSP